MSAEQRAREAFAAAFGGEPDVVARAPGRINLIGEHVDYNGGLVLPVAIDRHVCVAGRAVRGRVVRVIAADVAENDRFVLEQIARDASGWRQYVRGVAALLADEGVPLPGAELAIAGDVPIGAGLSSSAALEVAMATALLSLASAYMPGTEVAALCRRAEQEWAGVQCGIMDQFVAALARGEHAMLLDCRSLEHRHIRVPPDVRIIAVDSGVRRDLRGAEYNRRFEECREAAQLFGVAQLRDVTVEQLAAREASLPETLRKRARHVVSEIERTRRAGAALEAGDMKQFGALMHASHASLRDDFEVSTPELDRLVDAAREIDGVYGSRLTGAGFGGCTVSLVAEGAVEELVRRMGEKAMVFRAA